MKPFSQKMTNQLLAWYCKQPELERKECHVEQKKRVNVVMNEARKNGQKIEADGALYYRAFIEGVKIRSRLHSNRKLRSTDDLEAVTAQRITVAKAQMKAKPSPKLDRLQNDLEPVIKRLRAEGFSWERVSRYLAENHRMKCTRGYLQKVFSGQ